jgi:small subunit ribosomal protein S2
MYCDLISGAVLDGLQQEAIATGADIGESAELPAEQIPAAEGEAAQPAAQA